MHIYKTNIYMKIHGTILHHLGCSNNSRNCVETNIYRIFFPSTIKYNKCDIIITFGCVSQQKSSHAMPRNGFPYVCWREGSPLQRYINPLDHQLERYIITFFLKQKRKHPSQAHTTKLLETMGLDKGMEIWWC